MVIQTMIELCNPFDAYARLLGECTVLFMIAGSNSSNPQFVVMLYGSGLLRTVDQNDLIVYGNASFDKDWKRTIPEEWKRKYKA